jgi:hypothetical protein
VNSGAVLLGGGTVGSTLVNAGGFLVPGQIGTPGMMTVAGDLTIQRNAFYVVQVNPRAASSINVSGTASLDGTVAAVFFPGLYLARSYTILTADNRRTGRFEDLRDLWPATQLEGQAGLFQQYRRPQPEGAAHSRWWWSVSRAADRAARAAAADTGVARYAAGPARPPT